MRDKQKELATLVTATWSHELMYNPRERALRFLEEAVELVQAMRLTRDEVFTSVLRVYSRPPGDAPKEIGQVYQTLLCTAEALDVDASAQLEQNVEYIRNNRDLLRSRFLQKQADGVTSGVPLS